MTARRQGRFSRPSIELWPPSTSPLFPGSPPADGVESYTYEGQTKFGGHYRVRYFLQPATRRRYTVTRVDGRERFGAPKATTDTGDVQVWWYPGSQHEMFARRFRAGQFLDAFRISQEEFATLPAKPAPY